MSSRKVTVMLPEPVIEALHQKWIDEGAAFGGKSAIVERAIRELIARDKLRQLEEAETGGSNANT